MPKKGCKQTQEHRYSTSVAMKAAWKKKKEQEAALLARLEKLILEAEQR